MALGFVGSRRRNPSFDNVLRWGGTVDGDVSPTASPISRTDGGSPRSRIDLSMISSIWRCRSVNVCSVMVAPASRLAHRSDLSIGFADQVSIERMFGEPYQNGARVANTCSKSG